MRRTRHTGLVLLSTLALLLAGTEAVHASSGAPPPTGGLLADPEGSVQWRGSFQDVAAPSSPEPYAAAGSCEGLSCEEFDIDVALPPDIWNRGPGGVQVAIDWFPAEANDLDLYVYGPAGSLVARSDGIFASTGESVRLDHAGNGRYRAVVVPRFVEGSMDFQGFAEVEWAPAAQPVRPFLPNLVALPARNPTMHTGAYLVDHKQEGTPSCYPEETAEEGARRCLRFDQIIANHGEGPFELRYRLEGMATDQQLRQRIYSSDGSFTDVAVDTYEFHPTHAHFHYKSFGQAVLYRARPDGSLELVREGRKNGFCMLDVENTRFGLDGSGRRYQGEAPRRYHFPDCNIASEVDASGAALVNGISAGWADVYNWFLADQYIEITGVPDGEYVLETLANPIRTVHETTLDDNTARVRIRLAGDTVELIG